MDRVTRYMLDTNIVGHLIEQHPAVVRRVVAASMVSLCISAVTAGELLFGLARRPDAVQFQRAVGEFLQRVDVLPWDNDVAKRCGSVRADMVRGGKILAPFDLLIATHALSVGAVLVTNDRAFR
jgi:tRNA(fMet)-specific endonuclease VapC